MSSKDWFIGYFDELYYKTYKPYEDEDHNKMEAEFIANVLNLPKGSKILDVGCGYARHAVYLAKMGYYVSCLDISDYLLKKAEERIREFNVYNLIRIIKCDMRNMNFDHEYDAAYIFYTTFGYFSDDENFKVLNNLNKALKKSGLLLIDVPNPFRMFSSALHASLLRGRDATRYIWWESGGYYILEKHDIDVLNSRWIMDRVFIDKNTGRKISQRVSIVRIYMPTELKRLLNEAGFKIIKLYGDYKSGEYSILSPRLIILSQAR